jgi:hypothetical protein
MASSDGKISFAGTVLNNGNRHFCAFFRTEEEQMRTLLPFIREGLAAGEKAIHIVNAKTCDEHRRRLIAAGIDVASAEKSGQLEVVAWPNSELLGGGEFDPRPPIRVSLPRATSCSRP